MMSAPWLLPRLVDPKEPSRWPSNRYAMRVSKLVQAATSRGRKAAKAPRSEVLRWTVPWTCTPRDTVHGPARSEAPALAVVEGTQTTREGEGLMVGSATWSFPRRTLEAFRKDRKSVV